MEIKGVIFDYGGTLDSFGDHWSEVIYQGYINAGAPIEKEDFRKGYVYAERLLASKRLIFPGDNFLKLMQVKIANEVDYLWKEGYLNDYLDKKAGEVNTIVSQPEPESQPQPENILAEVALNVAQYCYDQAKKSIAAARPILEQLHERYPMVLVSNFYGNIESVILDMGIRHLFNGIIESSNVGVRKPDPRIFSLGITVLDMEPKDVVVIGDSYKKDIQPALKLGCQAVWIKGKQWSKEEEDNPGEGCTVIRSLKELVPLLLD